MSATKISELAQVYVAHTGLTEATVSSYALNDGKLLKRYREKKGDLTVTRYERTLKWFSAHWPADLEWPADIPRPGPTETSVTPKRGAA